MSFLSNSLLVRETIKMRCLVVITVLTIFCKSNLLVASNWKDKLTVLINTCFSYPCESNKDCIWKLCTVGTPTCVKHPNLRKNCCSCHDVYTKKATQLLRYSKVRTPNATSVTQLKRPDLAVNKITNLENSRSSTTLSVSATTVQRNEIQNTTLTLPAVIKTEKVMNIEKNYNTSSTSATTESSTSLKGNQVKSPIILGSVNYGSSKKTRQIYRYHKGGQKELLPRFLQHIHRILYGK